MKGIIALDIDGTITAEKHTVPTEVEEYLSHLYREGWVFIFVTGRPFTWGYLSLTNLPFPYYLAVQNGAVVLEMPKSKVIAKHYLNPSIFPQMEVICQNEPTDFVVYSGFEYQDICYYRSAYFDPKMLAYVQDRAKEIEEAWIDLPSYESLPISSFPSVKCFGDYASAKRIHDQVEEQLGLHNPIIKDPLGEYYVIQVTAAHVTKGETVLAFKKLLGCTGPIIAAGDDTNDESMLKIADIKVVMETAPEHILSLADIIAPSAVEKGIICGLEQAVQSYSQRS